MKKLRLLAYLSFFLVLANSTIIFAQTKKYQHQTRVEFKDNVDAPLTAKERRQIEEIYGEHMYKEILNRPNRLRSIKNILRNRVVIYKAEDAKSHKDCQLLSSVDLFNHFVPDLKRDEFFMKENFNPLKYEFSFFSRHSSLIRVDNTDYYIYIKSQFSK